MRIKYEDRTDTGLCEALIMISPSELPISDIARNDAHIASTGVRDAAAHPGLPYQKMKRESSDASKIQLNQAT